MGTLATGTEADNLNITSALQLNVNAGANFYDLTADALVQIEVQLGNGANLLHTDGGALAIVVKVTPTDTGDECAKPQETMVLTAGVRTALLSFRPFWALSGTRIKVFAKSSNVGDTSVGGIVWIADIAPPTVTAFVAALMADTGFTVGGSMTYEELQKLMAAWVAGNWRDKSGDADTKQLLDADDAATAVLEMSLSETTPQRTITII